MPSAIGDVVPALVATFTTALAAQPTVVYSGPKPTHEHPTEYVLVAYLPDDVDAVTTEQDISPMGNRWIDETGEVSCSVVCWSGDDDAAPLLVRADDLLDILDASLAASPTLGGAIAQGHYARVLGRGALAQGGDTKGVKVTLTVTVVYSTLLVS